MPPTTILAMTDTDAVSHFFALARQSNDSEGLQREILRIQQEFEIKGIIF